MMMRQGGHPFGMFEGDRQFFEPACLNSERERYLEPELAKADLDRRLPGRGYAHINRVSGADFGAGAFVQISAVLAPP